MKFTNIVNDAITALMPADITRTKGVLLVPVTVGRPSGSHPSSAIEGQINGVIDTCIHFP
jgi:hypothetical protein